MPRTRFPLVLALSLSLALVLGAAVNTASGATVEFLDGKTLECKVLKRDEKEMTIEVTMSGMAVERTIPLNTVHKVTINAKVYVINEKAAGTSKAAAKTKSKTAGKKGGAKSADDNPEAGDDDADSAGAGKTLRTKAEVNAYIDEQGRTPPDWFEATPLNPPASLDLTWPEPAPGGWNNQKNMGQYIWDVINPNESKWREGVKLMHHLLTLHKDDPEKQVRIMNTLGTMYHNLHEDYARAAFWWRQAGVDQGGKHANNSIHLAECYWRLGNKQMALDLLKKAPNTYNKIKLLADMGNLEQAVQLAGRFADSPNAAADMAWLYAADGYRLAGKFPQAVQYYEKVLSVPANDPGKGRVERNHNRARASLEAIRLFELADVSKVANGTYEGESLGYEGPVRVSVVVSGGKIESVAVVEHREKQYYSSIKDTPPKIVARQGVKGVDSTSGATITSEAIINATAKALANGK